jgi:hypothetical protein
MSARDELLEYGVDFRKRRSEFRATLRICKPRRRSLERGRLSLRVGARQNSNRYPNRTPHHDLHGRLQEIVIVRNTERFSVGHRVDDVIDTELVT